MVKVFSSTTKITFLFLKFCNMKNSSREKYFIRETSYIFLKNKTCVTEGIKNSYFVPPIAEFLFFFCFPL